MPSNDEEKLQRVRELKQLFREQMEQKGDVDPEVADELNALVEETGAADEIGDPDEVPTIPPRRLRRS